MIGALLHKLLHFGPHSHQAVCICRSSPLRAPAEHERSYPAFLVMLDNVGVAVVAIVMGLNLLEVLPFRLPSLDVDVRTLSVPPILQVSVTTLIHRNSPLCLFALPQCLFVLSLCLLGLPVPLVSYHTYH